jgi:opacity protein-like surface antigen
MPARWLSTCILPPQKSGESLYIGPNKLKIVRRSNLLLLLAILCSSSVAVAQGAAALPRYELFGGYSVNTDSVKNRSAIFVVDQTVSPFFNHGSGPIGFEVSVKRYMRGGLSIKTNFSSYSDTFPPGKAAYCQSSGCATGLSFQASNRSYYFTAGPEWKFRRDKGFSPYVQALAGIVHERAEFAMEGSDSGLPFNGGLLLGTSTGFPSNQNIKYSDSHADTGPALSVGAGFDIRLTRRLAFRTSMDYDPTFLVRPVITDPIPDAQGRVVLTNPIPSQRNVQHHTRATIGFVWSFH